jgi:hypothetical protein
MKIEFVFDVGADDVEVFIIRFDEFEDVFNVVYEAYDLIQPFFPSCRMLSMRTVFD